MRLSTLRPLRALAARGAALLTASWLASPTRLLALLPLLLVALAAHAQVPAWVAAASGSPGQTLPGNYSTIRATATDPATGNVYVAGYFLGTISFGATQLTSAGAIDLFVAKWDATANVWAGAVRGGGPDNDYAYGIAVVRAGGVASIYVTGSFGSSSTTSIAGTTLPGAGREDMYVAKYTDSGAGLSTTGGGAVSGGGTGDERGQSIAVLPTASGTSVYVVGYFGIGGAASIAGSSLTSAGSLDVFVAKYTEAGPGFSLTGGGALSGGGTGADYGYGLAAVSVAGVVSVYVAGQFSGSATLAGTALTAAGGFDLFVAKYLDTAAGLSATGGGAVRGGGTGDDLASGLAALSTGGTTSLYVAGRFASGAAASIAGTTLPGAGGTDLFVAKYLDSGTGLSATGGAAVSGGGPGDEAGQAVAAVRTSSNTTVYVTGYFTSTSNALIAGTTLASAGNADVVVAKYTDSGTGLSATGGGAVRGGGTGSDAGSSVAIAGQRVYMGGSFTPPATFGSTTLTGPTSGDFFPVLARLDDATLTPLAARAASAPLPLALYPNPTSGAATLSGTLPGAAVQVLDALGRVVATATAEADGTATLGALPAGVYVVRAGSGAVRLAVQ